MLINREGLAEYNCEPDATVHRKPGLSALIRLYNEAVWIGPCLESCVDWFDELVICLNRCTDDTPAIVERFWASHPDKIRVFDYPFKIHEMGPRHSECPADSVHSSAYYYNYCQAQSTHTVVCKVDGDMIFQDWAGAEIRRLMAAGHERIKFHGVDLVDDARHVGCHPHCPTNGTYRIQPGVYYRQGPVTQNIARALPPPTATIGRPCFVHMKWSKPFESATVQWPANWQDIPHFQNIAKRRFPVASYEGEYPASVAALL